MKNYISLVVACVVIVISLPFNLKADDALLKCYELAQNLKADDSSKPPVLKPRPIDGFKSPRIRRDWTDVLNSEDMSQAGRKAYGDLAGATVSYSHNGETSTNTWTTVGSVIVPYMKYSDLQYGTWSPILSTFAPSVSVNRVSSSGNTANDVDHLDYRFGFYGKWLPQREGLTGFLARGALVYGTDTGHHASMPAVELELEPRFWWNRHGIGYRNVLIPRKPTKKDGSDNSGMDIQLRVWLHIEGGDLQRNGAKWDTVDGSFFRLGPMAEGKVNFPQLLKGFSINTQYSYVPALSGPTGHDSLFKIGGSLTLYQDPNNEDQKISLTADFTKGGLMLSKQDVDVFNLGIGMVF